MGLYDRFPLLARSPGPWLLCGTAGSLWSEGINKQVAFHPSPTPLLALDSPKRLSEVGGWSRRLGPGLRRAGIREEGPDPLQPLATRARTPLPPLPPKPHPAPRLPAGRAPRSPPSGRARVAAGAGRLAGGGRRAAGAARRRQARGSAPRPPRPDGRAAPSAPRSAQTEQPPLQCQQPQPRRQRERQRPGPRGSRQRGTARRARTARARGHLAAWGRCGRFCAPRRGARTPDQPGCGRAQRTADTGLRGGCAQGPAGTGSRTAFPARLPSPGAGARAGVGPVI